MQVAIYCRVSKREQNPENQRIQLEDYAKRMNYDYAVFEEKESTRKTRPIKQELMNRLRQKELERWCVQKTRGSEYSRLRFAFSFVHSSL